jgi:signal transduction histidine kinase
MNTKQIEFLTKLPLLLNSALDSKRIVQVLLEHLARELNAEAGTVFLKEGTSDTLSFWALKGDKGKELEGAKLPAGQGIVGWVVREKKSALVPDVSKDPRFFKTVDLEKKFTTKNMICVPLLVRGDVVRGAIQILNKKAPELFTEEDREFLEHCAQHAALAIDNALLYQHLAERNTHLEQVDKKKSELLTLLAHELKTPLNVIHTASDIIMHQIQQMREAPETLKASLATLEKGVRRLIKLSSQIKESTQLHAELLKPTLSTLKVSSLFNVLESRFASVCHTRKLRLTINDASDITIRGDEVLLLIALRNLIANAIRFTADGGEILLSAKREHGMVIIAVRDTGIGIAPEQHRAIFEKFYEVAGIMEHSSGEFEFRSCGLGLGLATAQTILKAHGSTLELQSAVGKGSTFSFALIGG